jgi:hypothetical protein
LTRGKAIDLKDQKELIAYSVFCKQNNLILSGGYFFRPLNHSNIDHPFSSHQCLTTLRLTRTHFLNYGVSHHQIHLNLLNSVLNKEMAGNLSDKFKGLFTRSVLSIAVFP